MDRVSGIYKSGTVTLQHDVNWPEGADVEVVCTAGVDRSVVGEIFEDSPKAIAQWLEWFDSLSPVFTDEEVAAFENHLRQSREEQKILHPQWEQQLDQLLK